MPRNKPAEYPTPHSPFPIPRPRASPTPRLATIKRTRHADPAPSAQNLSLIGRQLPLKESRKLSDEIGQHALTVLAPPLYLDDERELAQDIVEFAPKQAEKLELDAKEAVKIPRIIFDPSTIRPLSIFQEKVFVNKACATSNS